VRELEFDSNQTRQVNTSLKWRK